MLKLASVSTVNGRWLVNHVCFIIHLTTPDIQIHKCHFTATVHIWFVSWQIFLWCYTAYQTC